MESISKFNVTHHFEKRALLGLINAVAGLSIFFFGYDQGLMGGVVTNRNYAETMGFGYWDGTEVKVTKPLLKGGIVRVSLQYHSQGAHFFAECRLLPTRHSGWSVAWGLDR